MKTKYPEVHPLGIVSTLEETQNDYYIFSKIILKLAIINYSGFVGKSILAKDKFRFNIISLKNVEQTVQKLKPI